MCQEACLVTCKMSSLDLAQAFLKFVWNAILGISAQCADSFSDRFMTANWLELLCSTCQVMLLWWINTVVHVIKCVVTISLMFIGSGCRSRSKITSEMLVDACPMIHKQVLSTKSTIQRFSLLRMVWSPQLGYVMVSQNAHLPYSSGNIWNDIFALCIFVRALRSQLQVDLCAKLLCWKYSGELTVFNFERLKIYPEVLRFFEKRGSYWYFTG